MAAGASVRAVNVRTSGGALRLWPWSPAGGAFRVNLPQDKVVTGPEVNADMRRRLLCVAADLFRRKGFAQSTTRELAQLLGLKKASLYYYVTSKQELLYELCLESVRTISNEVAAAVEQTPPEGRLQSAIRSHVETAARDRDLHAVMLTELRALAPLRLAEVIEARAGYERQVRQLVARDQESGRLRSDVDAKYLTLMLLNLLNWTIFWYDPSGPLPAPKLGELLARQFFEGARSKAQVEEGSGKATTAHGTVEAYQWRD
jgi:AcrR family transcriptional regulator